MQQAPNTPPETPCIARIIRRNVAPYLEKHPCAVLYGIVGFVIAALILIIGFWPTVLLVIFATIGILIGRYRDGDHALRTRARMLFERLK